jgi:hypothetical protein
MKYLPCNVSKVRELINHNFSRMGRASGVTFHSRLQQLQKATTTVHNSRFGLREFVQRYADAGTHHQDHKSEALQR